MSSTPSTEGGVCRLLYGVGRYTCVHGPVGTWVVKAPLRSAAHNWNSWNLKEVCLYDVVTFFKGWGSKSCNTCLCITLTATQHLPCTFSPGYGSPVLGKKPTNDAIPYLLEFSRNTSRYLTGAASECLLVK